MGGRWNGAEGEHREGGLMCGSAQEGGDGGQMDLSIMQNPNPHLWAGHP